MVYKVGVSTELASTEPLVMGENRNRFLRASGHDGAIHWSTHNLVLCVFLFKGTLFNLHWWFINIELMANGIVSHAWTKLT